MDKMNLIDAIEYVFCGTFTWIMYKVLNIPDLKIRSVSIFTFILYIFN